MRSTNKISSDIISKYTISDDEMNEYKQHLSNLNLTDQRKEEVIYALAYFIDKIIDDAFGINTITKQHSDERNNDIYDGRFSTPNRSPRTVNPMKNNGELKKHKMKQK